MPWVISIERVSITFVIVCGGRIIWCVLWAEVIRVNEMEIERQTSANEIATVTVMLTYTFCSVAEIVMFSPLSLSLSYFTLLFWFSLLVSCFLFFFIFRCILFSCVSLVRVSFASSFYRFLELLLIFVYCLYGLTSCDISHCDDDERVQQPKEKSNLTFKWKVFLFLSEVIAIHTHIYWFVCAFCLYRPSTDIYISSRYSLSCIMSITLPSNIYTLST